MKKDNSDVKILIGALAGIVLIIGLSVFFYLKGDNTPSNPDNSGIVVTDVELFKELRDGDELSVIYVGRPSCPACSAFFPNLEKLVDNHDVTIYYINTETWTNANLVGVLEPIQDIPGVPTTFIMYDGESVDSQTKVMSYEDLVSWLRGFEVIE